MADTRILVVGAGLAGAATAWRLAQRGAAVTLIDRRSPAAVDGSSHGSARILRLAYPDLRYTRLVLQALEQWDELESVSGTTVVTPTSALDFGTIREPERLAQVLGAAGVEHELISSTEAHERWPQIRADSAVLHHRSGGVIDAETAVLTMVREAEGAGADVASDWSLSRLERRGSEFRAEAADGRFVHADRVVIAAGGWLPHLLQHLDLPAAFLDALPPLHVTEENAFHFPYRDDFEDAGPWPTFIHKRPDIQVYGLPGGRDAAFAGQKVAEYAAGRSIRSAIDQSGRIDPLNRQRVTDYVRRYLPGLVPEPYAETTCLFTSTPSEDFIIDGTQEVTILSACSGHGAKFAPLLGTIAADAVLGKPAPELFRLQAHAAA